MPNWKNCGPRFLFKVSFVKSTYLIWLANIFCGFSINSHRRNWWPKINHWLELWSDFSSKYSFGILNMKAKKLSYLHFHGLTVLHGQIIVWILKLPSQTTKLPSKIQIAVQKTLLNCTVHYLFCPCALRDPSTFLIESSSLSYVGFLTWIICL